VKAYDPKKPLISIHIPKCAGQSFTRVLRAWFGPNFYTHYSRTRHDLPPKHVLKPGMCIHGHFNKRKALGVTDYYPTVDQFITIVRDPLEIAISNYFFWKTKARAKQLELGIIEEGGRDDYRNIDDFFRQRRRSHIWKFMPWELTPDNYREILESRFIWIGLVEKLQESVDRLAESLGFDKAIMPHVNPSPRDEELSPALREEFIANNRLEFEIHRYVSESLIDSAVLQSRTGG
jgi:Sulfotransferase family